MATSTSTLPAPNNDAPTNPRGIPTFPFMTNVSDYVKSLSDVEPTLTRFQEMVSKYTFMQSNIESRAKGLREKLPEMKKSLDVVKFLVRKRSRVLSEPSKSNGVGSSEDDLDDDPSESPSQHSSDKLEVTFELQETLHARAHLIPSEIDSVHLWLGANVMVSYPLDEAETLLADKHTKAKESLKQAEEDLEFLREQITTLEVAVARVHNWDVGERRRLKKEGVTVDGEEKD